MGKSATRCFHLFIVNLQKRRFQHELSVFLPLLQLLEQVEEGSEDQAVILVTGVGLFADKLEIFNVFTLEALRNKLREFTNCGGPVSVCVFPLPVCP